MQHKNKSRITIAKALVLVSVSFMMLALLHVNYSTKYSYSGTNESTTSNTGSDGSLSPSSHHDSTIEDPVVPLPPSKPLEENNKNDKNYPGKIETPKTEVEPTPKTEVEPAPKTEVEPTPKKNGKESNADKGVVLSDSSIETTIRFENGTQYKTFKPEFFKHPEEAKKDLGSFLQTLATRSWWIHERLDGHGDDSDIINDPTTPTNDDGTKDEEEEDDERDEKDKSTQVPSRFFGYLPMGGGNNQFTSLQKAAILAKDLNRTLLMPPISPNSHIPTWAGPRYSQFYDLESFMTASKIPVIEWHDIKQTPEQVPGDFRKHWTEFAEDFPCTPNANIGINDHSLFDKFRLQFLFNYKPVFPEADTTHGKSTDFRYARDVLLKDDETTVAKTTPGAADPNLWRCLSCPYFLGGPSLSDRAWKEVGLHLRFNQETEAMVDDILDILLGPKINADGTEVPASKETFRPHPEFIIIHLRRGDIVSKCPPGKTEEECVVQIEAIAKKVEQIEKERKTKAEKENRLATYKALPVLVTTNEQRASELEKLYKLGWTLLDHGDDEKDPKTGVVKAGKTKKLGTETKLGPWYPSMLDAVLLTRGDYLIGMSVSRMSILATQRGKAWHGHTTMLMSA